MKSQLKIFLLTLVLGVLASSPALAQSNPEATVSSDQGVTLSVGDPLVETYDIDISEKGWSQNEAEAAVTYFEAKSHLIDLELDYPNQKLILTLDLDAPEVANWNVHTWNEHLVNVR